MRYTAHGDGNFYVYSTAGGATCAPKTTYDSQTIKCTIPPNNAGLTYVFTHTAGWMIGTIALEVGGKKTSTQLKGYFSRVGPCSTSQLNAPRACISGACIQSMAPSNNLQITDEKN